MKKKDICSLLKEKHYFYIFEKISLLFLWNIFSFYLFVIYYYYFIIYICFLFLVIFIGLLIIDPFNMSLSEINLISAIYSSPFYNWPMKFLKTILRVYLLDFLNQSFLFLDHVIDNIILFMCFLICANFNTRSIECCNICYSKFLLQYMPSIFTFIFLHDFISFD